ncbi:hypothetical protein GDO81_017818 [Engystomops pustulosus]|uniref:Uncharacterized protein n=1 Tax=Engystomops pustulosus TaxID=76066 RepID=A0AAV7A7L8_ENGPU|nr:hypothetical protein GDO81_017818 [Engystomops pustulosus]
MGYKDASRRAEIHRKAKILKDLSKHLYQKFGTKHTPLEILKRYNYLKNHQYPLLCAIRRKIALKRSQHPNAENIERAVSNLQAEISEEPSQSNPGEREEVLTLTLEPIPSERQTPHDLHANPTTSTLDLILQQFQQVSVKCDEILKIIRDLRIKVNQLEKRILTM